MKVNSRDFLGRLKADGVPEVVLLYGPEQALAARHAELLRRAVVAEDEEEMDAESFYGGDLDLGRFLSACNAFPFFARRRAVLLKEAEQLSAVAKEAVLSYINAPAKTALLVILAGPLDAKQSLRKKCELHKQAWAIPHFALEGRELLAWIRTQLHEVGFAADQDAVTLLGERLAGDTRNAASEIEKLTLFLGQRRQVTLDDVLESVGESSVQSGFALADAVFAGQVESALTILDQLLAGGEEPLLLLGLLAQRVRRFIQGRHLLDNGASLDEVATKLQVFWKEKGAFFAQVRQIPPRRVASGLMRCPEADQELKTGGVPALVMERLVMGLAQGVRGGHASVSAPAAAVAAPRRFQWPQ